MSNLFEGDFRGKAVKAEYGTDTKSGKPAVRVTMEIGEGPKAGIQVPYNGNFKAESIRYTKRDLMALGWQGKTIGTFVDDVMKAAKVVPFKVRIARYDNPETGKVSEWISVGSIGYEAPPLAAATNQLTANVDSWFNEADEAPSGNGKHPNAPGAEDAPF